MVFPEGTVLAKTFYYPRDLRDEASPRRIIETRLLVKTESAWNVATYLWNEAQTDASLLLTGTTTEVAWIDAAGQSRSTKYAVPHEGECVTCHQQDGSSVFIGPTVANLNRVVTRNGEEVSQLDHLVAAGVLDGGNWATAPHVPGYRDAWTGARVPTWTSTARIATAPAGGVLLPNETSTCASKRRSASRTS